VRECACACVRECACACVRECACACVRDKRTFKRRGSSTSIESRHDIYRLHALHIHTLCGAIEHIRDSNIFDRIHYVCVICLCGAHHT